MFPFGPMDLMIFGLIGILIAIVIINIVRPRKP